MGTRPWGCESVDSEKIALCSLYRREHRSHDDRGERSGRSSHRSSKHHRDRSRGEGDEKKTLTFKLQ